MRFGEYKTSSRRGMPNTKEVFGRTMRFDLSKGFPILTTKKVYFKGVVGELLWFLKGKTTLHYLWDNNIHIWDKDAYRYYQSLGGKDPYNTWSLKTLFKEKDEYGREYGELGNIYGKQWRDYNGEIDQIHYLIDNIKKNPYSRYHIVNSWNPSDFCKKGRAALPACHVLFQCNIRESNGIRYMDLHILQRSCDLFLGIPFNISSYALLLHILCYCTNYTPGHLIWTGSSVHIYENHFDAVSEQLTRTPRELPTLLIDDKDTLIEYPEDFEIDMFSLKDYNPYPAIKAELSVGIPDNTTK